MPVMQKIVSVPLNGSVNNVWADELHRFIPPGAAVRIALKAAATGIKAYILQQRPIVQGQDIPFDAASQNIRMSDDVLTSFTSEGGELFTELRNTTGAAINVTAKAEWLA
jgi:hypothetical protein